MIKTIVKKLTPFKAQKAISRQIKLLKRLKYIKGGRLSIDEFSDILTKKLHLQYGDSIMIHSSYGNLNTAFSPEEAIRTIQNIVGKEGNILMPFYPGSSYDWIKDENVFDVKKTKSTMGVLTNTFASLEGVKISLHPIKAVAAWGKDRDYLISTHHKSNTPYDKHSPYFKMLELKGSKSIGLGIERNTIFHACEDTISVYVNELYFEKKHTGYCIDYDGNKIKTETLVHIPEKTRNIALSGVFLKLTKCPSYRVVKHKRRLFYVLDNKLLHEHVLKMASAGTYRFNFKA